MTRKEIKDFLSNFQGDCPIELIMQDNGKKLEPTYSSKKKMLNDFDKFVSFCQKNNIGFCSEEATYQNDEQGRYKDFLKYYQGTYYILADVIYHFSLLPGSDKEKLSRVEGELFYELAQIKHKPRFTLSSNEKDYVFHLLVNRVGFVDSMLLLNEFYKNEELEPVPYAEWVNFIDNYDDYKDYPYSWQALMIKSQ